MLSYFHSFIDLGLFVAFMGAFGIFTNKRHILLSVICIEMMDNMLRLIDKHLRPGVNPIDFLDQILESSIQNNIMNEEYEICQVLHDIKNLLDE